MSYESAAVRLLDTIVPELHSAASMHQACDSLQVAAAPTDVVLHTMLNDLRHTLCGIRAWAIVVKRTPGATARMVRGIEGIEKAVQRHTTVLEDLLDSVRPGRGSPQL